MGAAPEKSSRQSHRAARTSGANGYYYLPQAMRAARLPWDRHVDELLTSTSAVALLYRQCESVCVIVGQKYYPQDRGANEWR